MNKNEINAPLQSPSSPSLHQTFVLSIFGKGDVPIYEADLSVVKKKDISEHLSQFILHQSLDTVDELVWRSSHMYLKTIDSFNNYSVSAYCTPGHIKFLLLYKNKNYISNITNNSHFYLPSDDNLRSFFEIVHENYIRVLLNPLYEPNGIIISSLFDQNIHLAAKKFLHQ
ncbi:trafficking protein particle complex subunit 2, putative [Hepatocystis sp. ex Piliocolobus tephrosceles]|nr:trafficking protein particle complex subunit 2, putative [Hepatocystis sp. ex Piliocolobus tephrosceles]